MLKQTLLLSIVTGLMLAGSAQAIWTEDFSGFADGATLNTGGWTAIASDWEYNQIVRDSVGYGSTKAASNTGGMGFGWRATDSGDNEVTARVKMPSGGRVYFYLQGGGNEGIHPYTTLKIRDGTITWRCESGEADDVVAYSNNTWYDVKLSSWDNGSTNPDTTTQYDVEAYYKESTSGTWIQIGTRYTQVTQHVGQPAEYYAPNYVAIATQAYAVIDDVSTVYYEPPTYRGDVNDDKFAGGADLTAVIHNWGDGGKTWAEGDVWHTGNAQSGSDGNIDVDDYNEVLAMWGTGTPQEPPPEPSAAPEPATLGLLLLGGLALIRRR